MTRSLSFQAPSVRSLDAFLPLLQHPNVARFASFSNSVSGFDKTLRLIIYTLKCVSLFLRDDAPLRLRILAIIGPMFESRYLLRMYGLLAMIPPLLSPTYPLRTKDKTIYKKAVLERLMTWSMWIYYPAEHLYYLKSHRIVGPVIAKPGETISSGDGWSQLSCAAWAVYIAADLYGSIEAWWPKWQELRALEIKARAAAGPQEKEKLGWAASGYLTALLYHDGVSAQRQRSGRPHKRIHAL